MWDSLGEIAQSLLDIAFSLFGFNIDLGNMGLTAKEFCDWNTITASEFGTLAEILNLSLIHIFCRAPIAHKPYKCSIYFI